MAPGSTSIMSQGRTTIRDLEAWLEGLSFTAGNLERVRNRRFEVMNQLETDRQNLDQVPNHHVMVENVENSQTCFRILQEWDERCDNILEEQRNNLSRPGGGPSQDEEDDSMDDGENDSDIDTPGENRGALNSQLSVSSCIRASFQIQYNQSRSRGTHECLLRTSRQDFVVKDRKIAETLFGAVYRVRLGKRASHGSMVIDIPQKSGWFALKEYGKSYMQRGVTKTGAHCAEDPRTELVVQQRLSRPGHENVLQLVDCLECEHNLYAIFPFAGCELFEVIQQSGPIREDWARQIFQQMIAGVMYCHEQGITHRDISPENFLFNQEDGRVTLIDFGVAAEMRRCSSTASGFEPIRFDKFVGKMMYSAPELHAQLGTFYDGVAIDTWSLMVTLYVMVTKMPPWSRAVPQDKAYRYFVCERSGWKPMLINKWRLGLSDELIDLFDRTFLHNPRERWTLEQIAQHPWVQQQQQQ